MIRFFIISVFLPLITLAQANKKFSKNDEKRIYTKAIHEYLEATFGKLKKYPDTLFMGPVEEHSSGSIPTLVDKTPVVLISQTELKTKFNYRTSLSFVNAVDFGLKSQPLTFIFISFFVEKSDDKINFWPLHNYNLELQTISKTNDFKVVKSGFEYNYSNKYTNGKTK